MAIKSRLLERRYTAHAQPMSELNITPLIDVLLVLLVMLIISIPIATNSIEVDLPNGRLVGPESPQIALIVTEGGAVLWNGEPVDRPTLEDRLALAATAPDAPVISFEPEANASYNDSVQVINLVDDANITKFAFAGAHQYRTFDAE
ncbi:ExbD/TolR family protein [Aurantiacibacter sp. MUD61]|uniref:ExbD/TolR family protein n=1 Tax=Aurantiacibacter sp. MUD61 TaxID=3009083 RepID=UPI0022EFEBAF|nr:biopolymer transporter ExbD [Aurantiacibacter sp. MUD61]